MPMRGAMTVTSKPCCLCRMFAGAAWRCILMPPPVHSLVCAAPRIRGQGEALRVQCVPAQGGQRSELERANLLADRPSGPVCGLRLHLQAPGHGGVPPRPSVCAGGAWSWGCRLLWHFILRVHKPLPNVCMCARTQHADPLLTETHNCSAQPTLRMPRACPFRCASCIGLPPCSACMHARCSSRPPSPTPSRCPSAASAPTLSRPAGRTARLCSRTRTPMEATPSAWVRRAPTPRPPDAMQCDAMQCMLLTQAIWHRVYLLGPA